MIYKSQCLDLICDETYIGEIGRRFSERIINHFGRDDNSHFYEHPEKTGHEIVNIDHLKTTNSKGNLQRHYVLNMKNLL